MRAWVVPARLERVVDGDTLDVTLDLGWKLYKRDLVRIEGIDAPELSTDAGKAARLALIGRLDVAVDLLVVSVGLDKYGRALATVYEPAAANGDYSLGRWMILNGYAKPWTGRGPKPA